MEDWWVLRGFHVESIWELLESLEVCLRRHPHYVFLLTTLSRFCRLVQWLLLSVGLLLNRKRVYYIDCNNPPTDNTQVYLTPMRSRMLQLVFAHTIYPEKAPQAGFLSSYFLFLCPQKKPRVFPLAFPRFFLRGFIL